MLEKLMPIELAIHDPYWVTSFELARQELTDALTPVQVFFQIEHVGSTAVPMLRAKPIVDMLIGIEDCCSVAKVEEIVASLSYQPWHSSEDRHSFERRTINDRPTHHIHLVIHMGTAWNNQIAFRDALRSRDKVRMEYEKLKLELAAQHSDTRDYSAAKTDFIQQVLASVRG